MKNIEIGRTGAILGLSLFLLNMFDGIATLTLITAGAAYELNPLMRYFLDKMGVGFLLPKMIFGMIAGLCIAIWWTYRAHIKGWEIRLCRILIITIIGVYSIVDLFQVVLLFKIGS